MAKYELGVLLGEYDGSQSFEVESGWVVTSDGWYAKQFWTTKTHSSYQNLYFSTIGTPLLYEYDYATTAKQRWSSDVTTHRLVSHAWAYSTNNPNFYSVTLGNVSSVAVPYGSSYITPIRAETQVTSNNDFNFGIVHDGGASHNGYFDDILTAIDVIDLHPNWGMSDNEIRNRAEHTTLNQGFRSYRWGDHLTWDVPIDFMNSSESDLVNEWWRNQYNLLWTVDSVNMFVVRIANDTTPFSTFRKPYQDQQQGTIKLQAISTGLAF